MVRCVSSLTALLTPHSVVIPATSVETGTPRRLVDTTARRQRKNFTEAPVFARYNMAFVHQLRKNFLVYLFCISFAIILKYECGEAASRDRRLRQGSDGVYCVPPKAFGTAFRPGPPTLPRIRQPEMHLLRALGGKAFQGGRAPGVSLEPLARCARCGVLCFFSRSLSGRLPRTSAHKPFAARRGMGNCRA